MVHLDKDIAKIHFIDVRRDIIYDILCICIHICVLYSHIISTL